MVDLGFVVLFEYLWFTLYLWLFLFRLLVLCACFVSGCVVNLYIVFFVALYACYCGVVCCVACLCGLIGFLTVVLCFAFLCYELWLFTWEVLCGELPEGCGACNVKRWCVLRWWWWRVFVLLGVC